MINIEKYVDSLLKGVSLSKKEKKELKFQFVDHINSLKDEFMVNGVSEKESIKLAIDQFGNQEQLSKLFNNRVAIKPIPKYIINIVFFMYLFILFGHYLKLDISEYATKRIVSINNFIPFLYIARLTKEAFTMIDINVIDSIMTYIVAFIPVGILIPVVINQHNSFKSNIKIYSLFSLGIVIVRLIFNIGFVTIDHFILHLSGCIIGYMIYYILMLNSPISKLLFIKGQD